MEWVQLSRGRESLEIPGFGRVVISPRDDAERGIIGYVWMWAWYSNWSDPLPSRDEAKRAALVFARERLSTALGTVEDAQNHMDRAVTFVD